MIFLQPLVKKLAPAAFVISVGAFDVAKCL